MQSLPSCQHQNDARLSSFLPSQLTRSYTSFQGTSSKHISPLSLQPPPANCHNGRSQIHQVWCHPESNKGGNAQAMHSWSRLQITRKSAEGCHFVVCVSRGVGVDKGWGLSLPDLGDVSICTVLCRDKWVGWEICHWSWHDIPLSRQWVGFFGSGEGRWWVLGLECWRSSLQSQLWGIEV